MSTEENKRLVLRWKEELYGKKNLDIIDELFADDYVGHIAGAPGPVHGRAALKGLFAAYFGSFDISETPGFIIAEGDMVAIHDSYLAKHVAPFRGVPATGREAAATGTDSYRIVDGRIVEQWFDADMTAFLQDLGVAP